MRSPDRVPYTAMSLYRAISLFWEIPPRHIGRYIAHYCFRVRGPHSAFAVPTFLWAQSKCKQTYFNLTVGKKIYRLLYEWSLVKNVALFFCLKQPFVSFLCWSTTIFDLVFFDLQLGIICRFSVGQCTRYLSNSLYSRLWNFENGPKKRGSRATHLQNTHNQSNTLRVSDTRYFDAKSTHIREFKALSFLSHSEEYC